MELGVMQVLGAILRRPPTVTTSTRAYAEVAGPKADVSTPVKLSTLSSCDRDGTTRRVA